MYKSWVTIKLVRILGAFWTIYFEMGKIFENVIFSENRHISKKYTAKTKAAGADLIILRFCIVNKYNNNNYKNTAVSPFLP